MPRRMRAVRGGGSTALLVFATTLPSIGIKHFSSKLRAIRREWHNDDIDLSQSASHSLADSLSCSTQVFVAMHISLKSREEREGEDEGDPPAPLLLSVAPLLYCFLPSVKEYPNTLLII